MMDYYKDSTNTNVIPIIRVGEVISITDVTKSGRIRVRIIGIDDSESDQSLIECVPLLPKYLGTLPKVGESVMLFQYEHNESSPTSTFKNKRFWVGPLITQPTKLDKEPYTDSLSILPDGYIKLKDPKLEIGTYGEDEDVVLQGRYNTDIIQKDRQIWLRAGKFVEGTPNKFNDKNLAYIQVKFGGEKIKRIIEEREVVTYVTPAPDILILADIKTITNSSTPLSGNLPKDRYLRDDINRTEVFVTIKDIKTGAVISTLINQTEFVGTSSRQDALDEVYEFIDENQGDRWKIKSQAEDLIKHYKGADGVATFNVTKQEVKKKIKEVKLVKNITQKGSVVNIVADKMNFISHNGEHTFNLTDPKGLITDEEQEKINNEAHPVVYGDNLVEFLELVKKYVSLHVHAYHGLPSDPSAVTTDVLRFDLNTLLNKNINTN